MVAEPIVIKELSMRQMLFHNAWKLHERGQIKHAKILEGFGRQEHEHIEFANWMIEAGMGHEYAKYLTICVDQFLKGVHPHRFKRTMRVIKKRDEDKKCQ